VPISAVQFSPVETYLKYPPFGAHDSHDSPKPFSTTVLFINVALSFGYGPKYRRLIVRLILLFAWQVYSFQVAVTAEA
jgi:hypothetical protein